MTGVIVWLVPATGASDVSASDDQVYVVVPKVGFGLPSPNVGGSDGICAAGTTATLTGNFDDDTSLASATAFFLSAIARAPRYLRQRQSPNGSPSRVRPNVLRQRQRFI